jgi:hypothetical protein
MKKSIIFGLLMVLATGIFAAKNTGLNYVTTNGNTVFCKDVKFGMSKVRLIGENGEMSKIDVASVDAFMVDDRLFEKLPLVNAQKETTGSTMMEFITSRNGLKLYRYVEYTDLVDLVTPVFSKASSGYEYYVYKDGQPYLKLDQKSAPSVLSFFGIEIKS